MTKLIEKERLVLSVLAGKQLFGLEIREAVKEKSGGRVRLSIGALYPILQYLESKSLITSEWTSTPGFKDCRRRHTCSALGLELINKDGENNDA